MASTIWKGLLTFGLVSIPVKLFRAARAEKIHMHNLERGTGARVRQLLVPDREPLPGKPASIPAGPVLASKIIPARTSPAPEPPPQSGAAAQTGSAAPPDRGIQRAELVRGFEYEKDKYVEFEREELEQIAPKASADMQIVEFVRFAEVDPVYLESSYYVGADTGGIKPYSLLFQALKKTGYAAIAEFVMHRRDQTMILRAGKHGIIGHTLFYEDEVQRANEFHADEASIAGREMDLAVKLVDALAAPFDPAKFKDKYRERLQTAISRKVESGTVHDAVQPAAPKPVVDIMEALQQSLARAKKPVARELETAAANAAAKAPARKKRAGGS